MSSHSAQRSALVAAVIFPLIAFGGSALPQTVQVPVHSVSDPGVISTRQTITPAGAQTAFKGTVNGVAFGKANELWVMTNDHLYQLDWRQNLVLSQRPLGGSAGLRSLTFDKAGDRPLVGLSASNDIHLATPKGAGLDRLGASLGKNIVGAMIAQGGKLLAPMIKDNKLAIVDLASGVQTSVTVGIAPVAVAATARVAYVSNWGGEKPLAGQASAPTGSDPAADLVRIDTRGIALPGTVSVIDLTSGALTRTINVGRHPTALALDEAASTLYVANTNDDSISVVDTAAGVVKRTIVLKPFTRAAVGIAPTALAIDARARRLYVACGGINAILVYDLAAGRIAGMIPTGWYPISVELNADSSLIAVGTLLGVGSGQNDGPARRYVHANRGSVHLIPMPDAAQLASDTAAVTENSHMQLVAAAPPAPDAKALPRAVPMRAGEASLIEHVVYIVKENRTYDQVFGDIAKGNGEPSLVMFGQDVTPNQHKLATDFALLDNFYATGRNSANGHQWLTQANETSYTLWPGYEGRSYPYDGSDPLAFSSGGFIWDAAAARGKSVAVFGEFAPSKGARDRPGMLKQWRDGATFDTQFHATSPIPPLDRVLVRNFPTYSTAIPDVVRARLFKAHLDEYEKAGAMPNLTIIQLPSDHTAGTTPGGSTPKAMVADNDLAVGQIVEALTKSRFWSKMAIFVVEDDAQNGVDHVDGHRTVCLVISPYTRHGVVDSTFYSHPSILKTIELMLGLPSLSLFDLIANDMRASFTDKADLTGYVAITPRQDIFELNPPATALNGAARQDALASARMAWDIPDAAPAETLNRILWRNIKGGRRHYPAAVNALFAPYSSGDESDD